MNKQTPSIPTVAPAPSLYEKNKLRIAGALNALGDIGLLVDGFASKSPFFKAAGWLYTAGAIIATFFGNPDRLHQVKTLNERAAEFTQEHDKPDTRNKAAQDILKNKDTTLGGRITSTLRRYSGQMMLAFYTAGAVAMLIHGIIKHGAASTEYKAAQLSGDGDAIAKAKGTVLEAKSTIGYGISSLSIKALSLIVKENKTPHTNSEKKGIVGWFREKPMRIFGYGSLITETMMGLRTYGKFKQYQAAKAAGESVKPENWGWSALTTGSYIISDLVIANTNKDAANAVGKLTDAEQHKIEEMMAETLSYHTAEKREKLANEAATFLEQESLVNGTRENLRGALLKRAEKLWTVRQQTATTETSGTLQRA